jgi:hypothetical protein
MINMLLYVTSFIAFFWHITWVSFVRNKEPKNLVCVGNEWTPRTSLKLEIERATRIFCFLN